MAIACLDDTGEEPRRRNRRTARLEHDASNQASIAIEEAFEVFEVVVSKRQREVPDRLGNSRIARRRPDVPVVPAVITTHEHELTPCERTGRPDSCGDRV